MVERFSEPIEFVLNKLKNGENVENFDVRNALDQWDKLKNRNPVAYAKVAPNGKLYDLRLTNNPYENQYHVIPLFK